MQNVLTALICFILFFYLQRNLTEYFVAVDVNNMLHLYASMLYERRILISCSKLSTVSNISTTFSLIIGRFFTYFSGINKPSLSLFLFQLTACVHGAAAMLYPMYWQHVYIPVLPQHLLDYCWWVRTQMYTYICFEGPPISNVFKIKLLSTSCQFLNLNNYLSQLLTFFASETVLTRCRRVLIYY